MEHDDRLGLRLAPVGNACRRRTAARRRLFPRSRGWRTDGATRRANRRAARWPALAAALVAATALAQAPRVVDLPTRPGVTQRFLYLPAAQPTAAAILFAGGDGGLRIDASGKFGWGGGNFLVRSRKLFVDRGVSVAVIDAPSDRQAPPWLSGFRQSPAHAVDVKAVVAWLRDEAKVPVWLIGTSAGTFSAAATALAGVGADGLVLTSTVVVDRRGGRTVATMPLETLRMPVLVVHHRDDACPSTPYAQVAPMFAKLASAPRSKLVTFDGGKDEGDPCEAFAHHGYPGLEPQVVEVIVEFILAK